MTCCNCKDVKTKISIQYINCFSFQASKLRIQVTEMKNVFCCKPNNDSSMHRHRAIKDRSYFSHRN